MAGRLIYSTLFAFVLFGMSHSHEGKNRDVRAITIDKNGANCFSKKYYSMKFYGDKTRTETADSEDICAWICWQYNAQGETCASANYDDYMKKCELNSNTHLDPGQSRWLKSLSGYTYMIPKSCESPDGKPLPQPQPTPAPTPSPDSESSSSGSESGSGSASTNNIQSGSCGQSSVKNKVARAFLTRGSHDRIVGGTEARPHSMPWIVSLRQYGFHFCGGTLVRANEKAEESDIVITAAHCVEDSPTFDVVAGAHSQRIKADGEESVRAGRSVIHPRYNLPRDSNDIAVVKLSKPIKFSSTIQPACLPAQGGNIGDGINGIVAGWGNLREGGISPDALNQVVLPTIGSESCKRKYPTLVPEAMLCAGYEAGQKDACQGDSGGPFVFVGQNGYTLHGVVSWGLGCARAGKPGVYARVSNYMDWIQQQIQSLTSVKA